MDEHARGCQGREYTCTCGYDAQREWKTMDSAPTDRVVLLTDINWPPSRLRGEKPPVKCGYLDEQTKTWKIWGASWEPTHWQSTPETPVIQR